MTKENAKDYLPLVQALADGKTIQRITSSGWQDWDDVVFNVPPSSCRIKPKPREWSVGLSAEGSVLNWSEKGKVDQFGAVAKIIRVREVIE